MKLPNEIQKAATSLGKYLNETSAVETYRKLAQDVQNDSDAVALEEKLNALYEHLAFQEKAGQPLDQEELNQYYTLRSSVRENLLISAREDQIKLVKLIFADAGKTITSVLGIDFSILAL